MIDYDALRAIQAVIEFQSFELAAHDLGITQSAVTQRIQNFESYLGMKLLVRKSPYKSTPKGKIYLSLLRKVSALEQEVIESEKEKPLVKIAINRDSLDLFFLEVLSDPSIAKNITLQIIADDQEFTLKHLKSGQVDMCISSTSKPLPKHTSIHLGDMKYALVCSKEFYQDYFKKGVNKTSLASSPLVVFDRNDKVQHIYLKEVYGIENTLHVNLMPSIPSFKRAIIGGFGYGLLPLIDIHKELKQGKLVLMNPKKDYSIPLYLHQWEYKKDYIKLLNEVILKSSKLLT